QSILGEFVQVSNKVIPEARIMMSLVDEIKDPPGKNKVMGIDFGRKLSDTAIVVYNTDSYEVVHTEILNAPIYKESWRAQYKRIRELAAKYNPIAIYIDAHGLGDVIQEELSDLPIVPVVLSEKTKRSVIENLVLAFEKGQVKIKGDKDEALINQLNSLIYLDPNMNRIGASHGEKDDLAIALALAVLGLEDSNPELNEVSPWHVRIRKSSWI
ncbi:hypothetical protein DRJ16_06685, partial [Candidatus Woesearchaeota archaeon]